MDECPCSHDSNRTFEIRAPPRMARRRDGEKGPSNRCAKEVLSKTENLFDRDKTLVFVDALISTT